MVIQNFENTWTSITAFIKAQAVRLGLPEDSISEGNIGDKIGISDTPNIRILAIPDEGSIGHNLPNVENMRFVFFVTGSPSKQVKTAICNSVNLSLLLRQILLTEAGLLKDSLSGSRISPEALHSTYCVMSFEMLCPYIGGLV